MHKTRDLLRQRLLRNAGFGMRLHLRLQCGNLLERTHREHLEIADHVRVRRPQEVLVPVKNRRHLSVQEKRIAFRFAELLAGRVQEERKRQSVGGLAAHAVDEIGAGRDVAPLVSPADLHLATIVVIKVEKVVALQDLIGEFRKRESSFGGFQALLHRFLRQHLRHAEVDRDVAQELNGARALVPVVVVDHRRRVRPVEVENARKVLANALLVLLDLRDRQHVALRRLAGR